MSDPAQQLLSDEITFGQLGFLSRHLFADVFKQAALERGVL